MPGAPADLSAVTNTRDYLLAFEEELARAADGAALTAALTRRYPDYGMLIAAQIGAKVATGEELNTFDELDLGTVFVAFIGAAALLLVLEATSGRRR